MKRPSFQFYPADWLRDTSLRVCSVGARGLWIDMLCFMHDGTPYGYLKVGPKVILPANLASMVGATLLETEGWLKELEEVEAFSRDDDGCIFCRRMIRDEEVRNKRAAGGILGGNPALKVDPRLTSKVNQKPTPSSSSPSSSSKFIKPTLEEVREYGLSLNPPFLKPEKWLAFYEGKGWLVGKSKMKDWKATVRTWQLSEKEKTESQFQSRPLF